MDCSTVANPTSRTRAGRECCPRGRPPSPVSGRWPRSSSWSAWAMPRLCQSGWTISSHRPKVRSPVSAIISGVYRRRQDSPPSGPLGQRVAQGQTARNAFHLGNDHLESRRLRVAPNARREALGAVEGIAEQVGTARFVDGQDGGLNDFFRRVGVVMGERQRWRSGHACPGGSASSSRASATAGRARARSGIAPSASAADRRTRDCRGGPGGAPGGCGPCAGPPPPGRRQRRCTSPGATAPALGL